MKIRYLITGLLVSAIAAVSCSKPDDLVRTGSDVSTLTVNGFFPSDVNRTNAYPSIVDMATKTISVQIPWFMSDTEEIQADLTAMTLTATLPWGTIFEPGLSGTHDLQTGIQRTLVYDDGTKTDFTIKAVYVKSNRNQVTKVSFPDAPNAVVAIKGPANAGGNGTIVVFRTGTSVDFLQSAIISVSPWATFTTDAPQNPDETYDLSGNPTITVTAQDGSQQNYVLEIATPEFVAPGQIGYISLLFGFQTTQADPHGFTVGANRSMAVVGDYLIVSSTTLNFPVFNRFSGELLTGVQVNTTGLPTGIIHAITNDDAGHMVAITYAANLKTDVSTNKLFEVYVWKNGITSAPDKIYSGDVTGSEFAAWRAKNNALSNANAWEIGRTVGVKGDITSGTAMLMSFANAMAGSALVMRMKLEDGVVQSITGSIRGLNSWGVRSKPIPLSFDAEECAFLMGSGNYRRRTVYTSEGAGNPVLAYEPGSDWWGTGTIGVGYIEFNGLKLAAVQNVIGLDNPLRVSNARLYVSDITSLGNAALMSAGKILDSRLDNYDPVRGPMGPGLGNPSVTGMTADSPFEGGTILGPNLDTSLMNATVQVGATGDVCFGASADGNAVQVYMLTTDNGIIAYELTRYDI